MKMNCKTVNAALVFSMLMVTPLAALETTDTTPITLNDEGEQVRVYNTDLSNNVDLTYGAETYTINVHVRGNWELIPDESTAYKDEGGNVLYTRFDAEYDDADFTVMIDAPSAITVSLEEVAFTHDEADDHLVATVDIKFQRSGSTGSKLWCYKSFDIDVDQLDIPVEIPVEPTVNE